MKNQPIKVIYLTLIFLAEDQINQIAQQNNVKKEIIDRMSQELQSLSKAFDQACLNYQTRLKWDKKFSQSTKGLKAYISSRKNEYQRKYNNHSEKWKKIEEKSINFKGSKKQKRKQSTKSVCLSGKSIWNLKQTAIVNKSSQKSEKKSIIEGSRNSFNEDLQENLRAFALQFEKLNKNKVYQQKAYLKLSRKSKNHQKCECK